MEDRLAPSPVGGIRLEIVPASVGFRIVSAMVCTPLFAIGLIAAAKVVIALAAGKTYLPFQWFVGAGIAILFTVIPAIGVYVALKGTYVLLLDPASGVVTLMRRFAFRTWTRHAALAAMPDPELRFDEGDSESMPGYSLVIKLPEGGRLRYQGSSSSSLGEQRAELKAVCERIQSLIAGARRSEAA